MSHKRRAIHGVLALALACCDHAPAAEPQLRPTASSGGQRAPRVLVAFSPYNAARPFEVDRVVTLSSVDEAIASLFDALDAQRRNIAPQSGRRLREVMIEQAFVDFSVHRRAGAVESVDVFVSPRITALRHGATLARATVIEPSGQSRVIELFLRKPAAGFADAHNHPWASLGYDNLVVWGRAWCPLSTHGRGCPANHDAHVGLTAVATGDAHGSSPALGYPTFRDWPRWDNWTHLVSHPAMLYRAWRGGQRLMVGFAVNNYSGCIGAVSFARGQDARCTDDDAATERQIRAAYWTQAFVDAQWGGPGRGWFRIVKTPREARRVMSDGKLAVVLGIEVDSPFGCGPNNPRCTSEYVRRKLDEAYACGVRHMFPIHFWDNAFGGAGLQHQLSGPSAAAMASPDDRYDWPASRHFGDYGRLPFVDPLLEANGAVNRRGLTELGREFIRELMARRMIIDVDHQSDRSTLETLEVCDDARARWRAGGDQYAYPITGGHITALAWMAGDARQEGNMTPEELVRIRDSGGMVSVITTIAKEASWLVRHGQRGGAHAQSAALEWARDELPWTEPQTSQTFAHHLLLAAAAMPSGVGFGTDANGGNIQFGPRREGPRWPEGHWYCLSTRDVLDGSGLCEGSYRAGASVVSERWSSDRASFDRLGPHYITDRGTIEDSPAAATALAAVGVTPQSAHRFDFSRDGFAHAGMLPDVVQDLRVQGVHETAIDSMLRSAEEYVSMWERAELAADRMGLANPAITSAACPWSVESAPECPNVGVDGPGGSR
ncbi:MAG: membrane dipeptidase [Polyangiales bacterium]